ncbi:MAG: TetR/AcrR family transcriptional regulator [Pseudomonadota bacterium]
MPSKSNMTEDEIVAASLQQFWRDGYHATSIEKLVASTGANRQAIYAAFGGKQALYLRCFATYYETVVEPALADLFSSAASLEQIEQYFETQIALAERGGLAGSGCFVANAATETAPHDDKAAEEVRLHMERLTAGFSNALGNGAPNLQFEDREALAEMLASFAQGLWSISRTVSNASILRRQAATMISLLKERISP